MGIQEVTMYRVVCDGPECEASPQDEDDYWAWADAGMAYDRANDGDWYTATTEDGTITALCDKHAPTCDCTGCDACRAYPDGSCKVQLLDDEWGKKCEDCVLETPEGQALTGPKPT